MLIKCPECQKEISDKALACPICGYPINSEKIVENNIQNNLRCPVLPTDLLIGKQLVNWSGSAAVKGVYENIGNSNDKISNGKVSLLLFDNGMRLCGKFYMKILDIHYSQVISVEELKGTELKDKSSIKRAVVGGVVFGPLGAIVGSISGVGAKNAKTFYLIINYWDVNTRNPFTISISCSTSSKYFIDRLYKEKK
ncbi:zinc ribbon domain-containing protein [Clostridium tagluense]|uniref:zinc ribbon domain-containing protein n=1 Tax=Clostridium tagluense TaxID=360422 RepID=UPI001CF1BEA3|nr:zinc ribbon domain-containing protein [Clostridium tagluense]MCB2297075.1 zinc ribbon domain-containing protein [Clostridium tagluense]